MGKKVIPETRIAIEETSDYVEMAAMATQAFGSSAAPFQAEHLQRFYERCFGLGTIVIALLSGDRKVGQVALVRQTVMAAGKAEKAVQVVDLFIMPEFRGSASIRKIYDEAARQCVEQGIRFIIALPNGKAKGVNEHFLGMKGSLLLPLRMGIAAPIAPRGVSVVEVRPDNRAEAIAALSDYATPDEDNGIPWNAELLVERMSDPTHRYALHKLDDVLLISSPRESRNIPYTMLCGFFVRNGAVPSRSKAAKVVRSACAKWRRPVFAYAGVNKRLPRLPGVQLRDNWRPSPLLVQLRDFNPERGAFTFDRFQVLDFDLG